MLTNDIKINLLKRVSNYFRKLWGKIIYKDRYEVARYILITTLKTATDHSEGTIDDFVDGLIETEIDRRYSHAKVRVK
jgi:hypothetical protein